MLAPVPEGTTLSGGAAASGAQSGQRDSSGTPAAHLPTRNFSEVLLFGTSAAIVLLELGLGIPGIVLWTLGSGLYLGRLLLAVAMLYVIFDLPGCIAAPRGAAVGSHIVQ